VPAQPVPADRQASPIDIGKLDPLLTQLASKETGLFHQIRVRLSLLTVQPAG